MAGQIPGGKRKKKPRRRCGSRCALERIMRIVDAVECLRMEFQKTGIADKPGSDDHPQRGGCAQSKRFEERIKRPPKNGTPRQLQGKGSYPGDSRFPVDDSLGGMVARGGTDRELASVKRKLSHAF